MTPPHWKITYTILLFSLLKYITLPNISFNLGKIKDNQLKKERKYVKKKLNKISIDETMPHQINSPDFKDTNMEMEPPFVNDYGVVIGDSQYSSDQSPLEQWSDEIDPAIMSGREWIHPTNDIGWNTRENRELIENKKKPNASPFMHPTKDVSHGKD